MQCDTSTLHEQFQGFVFSLYGFYPVHIPWWDYHNFYMRAELTGQHTQIFNIEYVCVCVCVCVHVHVHVCVCVCVWVCEGGGGRGCCLSVCFCERAYLHLADNPLAIPPHTYTFKSPTHPSTVKHTHLNPPPTPPPSNIHIICA